MHRHRHTSRRGGIYRSLEVGTTLLRLPIVVWVGRDPNLRASICKVPDQTQVLDGVRHVQRPFGPVILAVTERCIVLRLFKVPARASAREGAKDLVIFGVEESITSRGWLRIVYIRGGRIDHVEGWLRIVSRQSSMGDI